MEDPLCAKFGPPPSPVWGGAIGRSWTTSQILCVQFVVNVLVLCALQPPFVVDFHENDTTSLNVCNALLVALVATASTVWLGRSFRVGEHKLAAVW